MQSKPQTAGTLLKQSNGDYVFSDYAITHNLTPFISMQNHYSLVYREEEREMFPTLKVCSPLALCRSCCLNIVYT